MTKEDRSTRCVIPAHHSAVRGMVAKASGSRYVAFSSLAEAQRDRDAAVIFEGDWGGQIYLTCPARFIQCTEAALGHLLADVDAVEWDANKGSGAAIYYERQPVGARIAGGMGGGVVEEGVWVHPKLERLGFADAIRAVIRGRAVTLPPSWVNAAVSFKRTVMRDRLIEMSRSQDVRVRQLAAEALGTLERRITR